MLFRRSMVTTVATVTRAESTPVAVRSVRRATHRHGATMAVVAIEGYGHGQSLHQKPGPRINDRQAKGQGQAHVPVQSQAMRPLREASDRARDRRSACPDSSRYLPQETGLVLRAESGSSAGYGMAPGCAAELALPQRESRGRDTIELLNGAFIMEGVGQIRFGCRSRPAAPANRGAPHGGGEHVSRSLRWTGTPAIIHHHRRNPHEALLSPRRLLHGRAHLSAGSGL
jgi:hypothetical protein